MNRKSILKRASPLRLTPFRRPRRPCRPCSMLAALACCTLTGLVGLSPRAGATAFWDTHGFEDDVDLVVDPNGEFVVIPEESEDGSIAQVTIFNLDPDTGAPLGPTAFRPALGFENAVDPMITVCTLGEPPIVTIPMESEDGSGAGILLLEVDETTGAILREEYIDLGDLGFRPDVDGTWTTYPFSRVTPLAMYALQSEFGGVQGVIAIDINNAAGDDFGDCLLISTDGRAGCTAPAVIADWLPGLADGVDPLSYPNLTVPAARMVLPVASAGGNDILLIDFDPNDAFGPPIYLGHVSVKETNAAGDHPTPFPGFECDVDMALFTTTCIAGNQLLVPVEGPGDDADLYVLDLGLDGEAVWTYSVDGDPLVTISGYEKGVDLIPMCGLPVAPTHRVAVPIENEAGTDADLLIINLETGALFAHAEDPVLNPGLTIPGYEIGIEPLRWTPGDLVVPAEGLDGLAKLYNFTPDADLVAFAFSNSYGYVRSVDPIVLSVPGIPDPLFMPVVKPDGSDADVWMSAGPPFPATTTLEVENAAFGLEFSGFEWDVDLGTVFGSHLEPHYMYLPEEDPEDGTGRVRFQEIPSIPEERKLVVATQEVGALPGMIYFFGSDGDVELDDEIWGLETGLDMADAGGPIRFANPPGGLVPGQDADTDPTMAWLTETAGVPGQLVNQASHWRVYHANPFLPSGSVGFTLPAAGEIEVAVFDVTGRQVRQMFKGRKGAGEHSISWDGRNASGEPVAAGVYFVRIHGDLGVAVSKFTIVR